MRFSYHLSAIVIILIICVTIVDCVVKIIGTRDEYSVIDSYIFGLPEIQTECYCEDAVDVQEKVTCDFRSSNICVVSNSSDAACVITIKAAQNEKMMRALKLRQNPTRSVYLLKHFDGKKELVTEIPHEFSRVKLEDDLIYEIRKTSEMSHPINQNQWYYGEDGNNDLRTSLEINDVFERNVTKLGWLRCDAINDGGSCEVDENQVRNSLRIDGTGCPEEKPEWSINAVHYFNQNHLLHSEIKGKSIVEITGGLVDNIVVNLKDKKVTVDYKINEKKVNPILIPTINGEKTFNFKAEITIDRYNNKLINVTIYESIANRVTVEVGEPGNTRSIFSLYHEKQNQTHQTRLSAFVTGPQWVCAYPTNDFTKSTCVKSSYSEENQRVSSENGVKFANYSEIDDRIYHTSNTSDNLLLKTRNSALSNSGLILTSMIIAAIVICLILLVVVGICGFPRCKKRNRWSFTSSKRSNVINYNKV